MSRAIALLALDLMSRDSSEIIVIGHDGRVVTPIELKAVDHRNIYAPFVRVDLEPNYTKFNSHFKRKKGRS